MLIRVLKIRNVVLEIGNLETFESFQLQLLIIWNKTSVNHTGSCNSAIKLSETKKEVERAFRFSQEIQC